jgi:hypothetical protein
LALCGGQRQPPTVAHKIFALVAPHKSWIHIPAMPNFMDRHAHTHTHTRTHVHAHTNTDHSSRRGARLHVALEHVVRTWWDAMNTHAHEKTTMRQHHTQDMCKTTRNRAPTHHHTNTKHTNDNVNLQNRERMQMCMR